MAHWEEDIASFNACNDGDASHLAEVFHLRDDATLPVYVRLGRFSLASENQHGVLLELTGRLMSQADGFDLSPEDIAAVSLMRRCMNREHQDGTVSDDDRLEHIGNVAIAWPEAPKLPITRLQRPNRNGIGAAIPQSGGLPLETVIHLPSPPESEQFPLATTIVEANPRAMVRHRQPYVLLHTNPITRQSSELVVHLEKVTVPNPIAQPASSAEEKQSS